MKEFTAYVIESAGFHARPSGIAVETAKRFTADSRIIYNGKSADLKSVLNVMTLAIPAKAKIIVRCIGVDEQEAIDSIYNTLSVKKVIS